MLLEALTLISFTTLGYLIGWSVNKYPIKHKGWTIYHWNGNADDNYYFTGSYKGKRVIVILRPNGDIDFDYGKDFLNEK